MVIFAWENGSESVMYLEVQWLKYVQTIFNIKNVNNTFINSTTKSQLDKK